MSSRRAASDRADLLAALVLAGDDTGVALRLGQVLGYRAPTAAGDDHDVASLGRHRQTGIVQGRQPQPARSGDAQQPSSQRAPLLAEHVGVVSVQPLAPSAGAGQGANAVKPLTAARCQPRSGSAPAFVPLVPPTRLWPALKASLTVRRQGAVDVQQLVATLGRGSLPGRLPRREQLLWGGALWLVWDVADRMHPYAQDFEQLQRALILLRGAAGLCQWTVAGRPDEVLAGPSAPARRRLPRTLPMPPPGTVMLLLTDLGALFDHPSTQAAWCRYADDLRRDGAIPVCWAPLASRQVGVAAAQALAVHCLQPGQARRAQRGRWRTPAQRLAEQQRLAGLRDALLVRAACCVQLEPAMLRALRLGSPALRGDPGVEGLLWACRPTLTTSLRSRPLTAEAAALWRPRLADLPVPDRLAVLAAMRRLHAGRGRSTEVMEALIWRAHAQLPAAALPTALAAHIEDARTWLVALAKAVDEPGLPLPGLAGYARDLLARQGADRVRLSQGFWLADSACTQALWLAVMGNNNPSHFKGDDQRPVENVSFDEVQQFLARLQALLPPGCEALLPTEAQWEYACRAGTDTPFNLPAPISRINVNFDASVTSELAVPGEESKTTVPVKSLPPNAWGLYEMHGNVWEWCADDQRDYAGTALRDAALEDTWGQVSQEQGAHRAMRGGSWGYPAGNLRSAYRYRLLRDDRIRYLGFRVALRSSPVGLAPEGPATALRPGRAGPAGRRAGAAWLGGSHA